MQHVKKIKQGCGKKIRDFARELGKTWPTVFCFFAKRVVIIMYIKIYKMSLLLSLYHVRPLRKKNKNRVFSNDSPIQFFLIGFVREVPFRIVQKFFPTSEMGRS